MENINIDEYQFIRNEMLNLKNCITTYIGFVLGGSGIAFLGFAAIAKETTKYCLLSFSSLTLALIISIVLLVLLYKFNSHNRYAGYCKLLNQEMVTQNCTINNEQEKQKFNIDPYPKIQRDFMSWEICMDRLRFSDFEEDPFKDILQDMKIEDKSDDEIKRIKAIVKEYSGKKPSIDKYRFFKGLLLLFEVFRGKVKTKSWQFPLFIFSIFIALVFLYIFLSYYFYQLSQKSDPCILSKNTQLIIYGSYLFVISYMWYHFIGKLYTIMCGSSTVDAYCWKFLPIRYAYIKEQCSKNEYRIGADINLKYSFITLKDKLDVKRGCH